MLPSGLLALLAAFLQALTGKWPEVTFTAHWRWEAAEETDGRGKHIDTIVVSLLVWRDWQKKEKCLKRPTKCLLLGYRLEKMSPSEPIRGWAGEVICCCHKYYSCLRFCHLGNCLKNKKVVLWGNQDCFLKKEVHIIALSDLAWGVLVPKLEQTLIKEVVDSKCLSGLFWKRIYLCV